MLLGLYIFRDDEYDDPLYAEPPSRELDESLWEALCEAANDAIEGEASAEGHSEHGDGWIAWQYREDDGLSFVAAVTDEVRPAQVDAYLKRLAQRYRDEVDEPRHPDKMGVVDVVVDIVPPWDED
jgi:hypothetical protein